MRLRSVRVLGITMCAVHERSVDYSSGAMGCKCVSLTSGKIHRIPERYTFRGDPRPRPHTLTEPMRTKLECVRNGGNVRSTSPKGPMSHPPPLRPPVLVGPSRRVLPSGAIAVRPAMPAGIRVDPYSTRGQG